MKSMTAKNTLKTAATAAGLVAALLLPTGCAAPATTAPATGGLLGSTVGGVTGGLTGALGGLTGAL